MIDSSKCPKCGYTSSKQASICQACGKSLRKVSKHRAMALVEGTAGIGKTTLIDALVEHHLALNPHINTLLRLGQSHTYAPLSPDSVEPKCTAEEQIGYLNRIYDLLGFLSHPTGPNAKPPLSCIIETLHLTLSAKPNILSEELIAAYDERLATIGCKLIFIQVPPDVLWDRCIWARRHNGFITIYAQKYGKSLEAIQAHYIQEQEQMLRLFRQSKMKKILLDGRLAVGALMAAAYDFWIGHSSDMNNR